MRTLPKEYKSDPCNGDDGMAYLAYQRIDDKYIAFYQTYTYPGCAIASVDSVQLYAEGDSYESAELNLQEILNSVEVTK